MPQVIEYPDLPVAIARHYWEEDVLMIRLAENNDGTAKLVIQVDPVEPRQAYGPGLHCWKRQDDTWELVQQ